MKSFTLCLFSCMIAIALAKVSYFEFPAPNSIHYQRTPIQFVASGVSHDDDVTIRVTLHACSDSRVVKILGDFNGKEVSSSGDDFAFTWLVDVPAGQYYVEVAELEEEDEDEDEDDGEDDEDDDRNISYNFQVVPWPYAASIYSRYQRK
ncbi:hypothetical protein G6F43_011325 [Rhizopus delemar]|nr:hypothetical protein G6F43_011325 [Rhizopus delemar]